MRQIGAMVAAVAVLLIGPVTASAANKEQQQLMAELRMLQQHQQVLQQMVVALTDSLKTVTTKMDEQSATARKALADQRLLIEGMTDTARVLREKADDTNVRLSSVTQELQALRQTIATMPAPSVGLTPTGDPGTPAS